MTVKLTNSTITKLIKTFNPSYAEGLGDWFLLYSDIFFQLSSKKLEDEIRRAFFRPTFLWVEENNNMKMGKFINNFPILWVIISQYSLPTDLTPQKLSVFELKNESIQSDYLIYETLELIQRQSKFLDPHQLYQKIAPLIDKAQCQQCFNTTKFTQTLFYELINISTANAHQKKAERLKCLIL